MNKIQLCFIAFGIIIGIVGILHGSAELLQGSTLVDSNSVPAMGENWPNTEFYTVMKGSPVFSILTGIPYYVLGIFAISISIALIVFSAKFFSLNAKGIFLFAFLSLGIFLFGAGQGTPFAISLPLVIFGVLSLLFPKKKERSESSKKRLLTSFNIFYWLQIFSWILFCPGLVIISFYGKIPQWLFLFDFMIMPISILGACITGYLLDKTIQNQQNEIRHV